MNERDWLGEDNKLGQDIWANKYRNGDETFSEWLDRVSGNNRELKEMIINKEFLFGGRILSNRGLNKDIHEAPVKWDFTLGVPEVGFEGGASLCPESIPELRSIKPGYKVRVCLKSVVMEGGREAKVNTGVPQQTVGLALRTNKGGVDNIPHIPGIEQSNRIESIGRSKDDDDTSFNLIKIECMDNGGIVYSVENKGHGEKIKSLNIEAYFYNKPKKGRKVSLSNCYVMTPCEDNLESIFDTAKNLAKTYAYGGGCGVDISKLRPTGSKVNNAASTTSGAVSFMDLFSLTTAIIGQNGRRGALMISIDINHPDVEQFISVKSDLNRVTKANISVRLDDRFMRAVKNNEEYESNFTVESTGEIIPHTVKAKVIFKELCRMNWDYAEPGLLFWDRISNWTLLSEDDEFEFAGTNPCAEEPLPAGGSCLLGSIILPSFLKDGVFDHIHLHNSVIKAVRALNDVLDDGLPLHPLQEQRDSVKDWRQIGLGIMGLGDLLINMGIKYGSPESLAVSKDIANTMIKAALYGSALCAKDEGAYPKYKKDAVFASEFFKEHTKDDEDLVALIEQYGLRNSQLLTIAPTGSIGTMIETSTGIEPVFAFSYTRKTESLHGEDRVYKVFTKIARDYVGKIHGKDVDSSTIELPEYFISAQNLDPLTRVDMQAVWQHHIDASISSTINLVKSTSVEEVENIYTRVWEKGLKGATIFRAGCKREGILVVGDEAKVEVPELMRGELKEVNEDTIYYPHSLVIGCGKLKVMVGYSPSERTIQDLYVIKSGSGGCEKNIQSVAIYMSGILRLGGNLFMLEKAIAGVSGCTSFATSREAGVEVSKGSTCASAMLNILKSFESKMGLNDEAKAKVLIEQAKVKPEKEEVETKAPCPKCGEPINMTGGCMSCPHCGYGKCDI